jgi:hypothetical protein
VSRIITFKPRDAGIYQGRAFEMGGAGLLVPSHSVITAQAEPLFDAENPDHQSIAFEDWSTYADASELGVRNLDAVPANGPNVARVDGGLDQYKQAYWRVEGTTGVPAAQWPFTPQYVSLVAGDGEPYTGAKMCRLDYSNRAPPATNRGLDVAFSAAFNSSVATFTGPKSIVLEVALKMSGDVPYEGKNLDWSDVMGIRRALQDIQEARMGGDPTFANNLLAKKFYTNGGATRIFDDSPPAWNTYAVNVNGDVAGGATISYKQTSGYGQGAGQFDPVSNAGLDGLGKGLHEAGWLWWKMRYTSDPYYTPGKYVVSRPIPGNLGFGRIEGWVGPTQGSMLKIIDLIGDVGAYCEGLIQMNPNAGGSLRLFGLTSFRFDSTGLDCFVELGRWHVWSHPVLSL